MTADERLGPGIISLPVTLCPSDATAARKNSELLWGWKRDAACRQRVILFGGTLEVRSSGSAGLRDWFFYYRTRSFDEELFDLHACLASENVASAIGRPSVRRCPRTRLSILELCGGPAIERRRSLIERLLRRRPRKRIPSGFFPLPVETPISLQALGPIAAYVGSGLSYEAGLPTLASVHEAFGVDRLGDADFTIGSRDPIPRQLAVSVNDTFASFAHLNLLSAAARPSTSHTKVASLHKRGILTRILTDNVDDLFSKLDVPFTRTRGVGIFNDRFAINFDRGETTLLVIGVAADRRSIIAQARRQGLRVLVVNPNVAVSPQSQNLSYLRESDVWYKMPAHDFLMQHVRD